MTPATSKPLTVQSTVFDLNSFEDVTLQKQAPFTPVANTHEALERLKGDANKLIDVINRGLRAEAQNAMKADPNIPWMEESEDGTLKPFDGIPADSATVNGLVLNMAKAMFGYNKDQDLDSRRAAKESAKNVIKTTPAIRENLQKQAQAALNQPTAE